ncbi:hypothetical protein INT48_003582 [Thamnidium elegans]|uniref:Reverse transcriptase domain-containing protein n=1 Tax=Thamnidium elegans TaxID=101142 RepID=A0A8H7VUC3_9FUNG|nr:hypothetical protein INT48_003582 [Thamnidium elegans]
MIKKRYATSASFSHAEGTTKALSVMSTHIASIYNGSFLPASITRPALVTIDRSDSPFEFPSFMFDSKTVQTYVMNLSYGKSPGTDHIKGEMLRPLRAIISPGDGKDHANCRPIPLTSVLRKLFEMVISGLVVSNSSELDVAQGGFRTQRSPLDQAWPFWILNQLSTL